MKCYVRRLTCNYLQICSACTGVDIELMRIVWPVIGSWAKWGCTGWCRWLASLEVPAKITWAHSNSKEHVVASNLYCNNYISVEQIFWLAIWIIASGYSLNNLTRLEPH